MEQFTKSNSDVNIANNINLESPSTSASEVHFQTTSSSALPLTSSTPQLLSNVNPSQPITVHTVPQLKFDPDNVEIFFCTFYAYYFNKNLNDERLYFELIKCLSPEQFHKISLQLNYSVTSFAVLKQALINVCNVPLHTKFSLLRNSPSLGDRTPTQLLQDF